jgi:hypothetical protein
MTTYSLQQAVDAAPVLARMAERIRLSGDMLSIVLPLIPGGLRTQVIAGPVDENGWCLLVSNPAVGSKIRQLTPVLLRALHAKGHAVDKLRVRVQGMPTGTRA